MFALDTRLSPWLADRPVLHIRRSVRVAVNGTPWHDEGRHFDAADHRQVRADNLLPSVGTMRDIVSSISICDCSVCNFR